MIFGFGFHAAMTAVTWSACRDGALLVKNTNNGGS